MQHLVKLLSLASGTICHRVIRGILIRLNLGIISWREGLDWRIKQKQFCGGSAVASPWGGGDVGSPCGRVAVLGIHFTSPQLSSEQKSFITAEGNTALHGVGSLCFSSQMGLEVRVCLGKENQGVAGAARSQSHACSEAVLLGGGCPGHWLLSAGAKAN